MSTVLTLPVESEQALRWQHAAVCRDACAELTLGIVHEMNNLTGGISVLSELYLQETATGLPPGEGLELIHKSTARLQALVRHLKIVHGPLRGEPVYLDLAEFVRGTLDLLAPALPRNAFVTTDFPAEPLVAHLDEAGLRQALLDVLLNVRDALLARLGGRVQHRVHVSLRRTAGANAELLLAPTDDAGAPLPDMDEPGTHRAESQTRWQDAVSVLRELGGRLTRGVGGEAIFELPLVG